MKVKVTPVNPRRVYVCSDDSYSVLLDLEISVELKPRSLSGVILSVFSHGAGPPGGDFLVLQLVNGQVSTTSVLYFVNMRSIANGIHVTIFCFLEHQNSKCVY